MTDDPTDFVTTQPAYGREPKQLAGVESDPMEAAVNLGAINTFYRSGRVIYADGFEDGLSPWERAPGAGGGAVTLDTAFSFFGTNSVKLLPHTVNTTRLIKNLPLIENRLHGLEFAFMQEDDGTDDVTDLKLFWDIKINGRYWRFNMLVDAENKKLQVWDGDGAAYVDIADLSTITAPNTGTPGDSASPRYFHVIKMVIDVDSLEYKYIRFNNELYTAAGISGNDISAAATDNVEFQFAASPTADLQVIWIDNVIYTVDEPDLPFD